MSQTDCESTNYFPKKIMNIGPKLVNLLDFNFTKCEKVQFGTKKNLLNSLNMLVSKISTSFDNYCNFINFDIKA